jgi:hypothetical protein
VWIICLFVRPQNVSITPSCLQVFHQQDSVNDSINRRSKASCSRRRFQAIHCVFVYVCLLLLFFSLLINGVVFFTETT